MCFCDAACASILPFTGLRDKVVFHQAQPATPLKPHPSRRSYGTLSGLVSSNADYIVDGACGQLRDLEGHPRAPFLLAALLRQSRAAAALLPLLSEPASAALAGVSITARRKAPQYVIAFVQVGRLRVRPFTLRHEVRSDLLEVWLRVVPYLACELMLHPTIAPMHLMDHRCGLWPVYKPLILTFEF